MRRAGGRRRPPGALLRGGDAAQPAGPTGRPGDRAVLSGVVGWTRGTDPTFDRPGPAGLSAFSRCLRWLIFAQVRNSGIGVSDFSRDDVGNKSLETFRNDRHCILFDRFFGRV